MRVVCIYYEEAGACVCEGCEQVCVLSVSTTRRQVRACVRAVSRYACCLHLLRGGRCVCVGGCGGCVQVRVCEGCVQVRVCEGCV